MKSETPPAAEKLQRLIDGELSINEVKQMMLAAEQSPNHWRTIACEFVEDQLFQRQFEDFADSAETQISKSVPVTKKDHTVLRNFGSSIRQAAVAAGIAIAGLFGYMLGSDGVAPVDATRRLDDVPSINLADNSALQPQVLTPVSIEPEYQLELLTADGEAINGQVDLYRYQDLNRLYTNEQDSRQLSFDDVLPPSGVSNEMRQRLSRSGYGVNESTNFVSGQLEDGRQFVVPVRSIRFDRGH